MNTQLRMELQTISQSINNMTDTSQIQMQYVIHEKKHWWINIFFTGLWQMMNGDLGFGLVLLLFGWLLLLFGGWIWALVNAYQQCKDFNNQLLFMINKRIAALDMILNLIRKFNL